MANVEKISTLFGKTIDETTKEEMWDYLEKAYEELVQLDKIITTLKIANIPKYEPKSWLSKLWGKINC